ncbi:C-type lectin domain family 4 member E-like [Discoglossus pictus]
MTLKIICEKMMEPEITYAVINLPQGSVQAKPTGTNNVADKISQNNPMSKRASLAVLFILVILLLAALVSLVVMYALASSALQRSLANYKSLNFTFQQLQNNYLKLSRCAQQCRNQPCEGIESSNGLECYLCPAGWLIHETQCYLFSVDKLSWNQSRNSCLSKKSDLLIINSQTEQAFITNNSWTGMFWIGLNDLQMESNFKWVDGSSLNVNITYWTEKQPDNHENAENCATVIKDIQRRDYKNWNDDKCEQDYHYICEKEAEDVAGEVKRSHF